MKRLTRSIFVCSLFIALFAFPVAAQENNPEKSLVVSPSFNTVDANDLGKTYTLKITNNTPADSVLRPSEVSIKRSLTGNIELVNDKQLNVLEFSKSEITVKAGETIDFPVRIKLTLSDNVDVFPAVEFKLIGGDGTSVVGGIVTPFIIQDFDGNLDVQLNFNSNQPGIATGNQLRLTGKVINSGQKFFNPAGTISVFKGDKKIFEKQITDQIQGLLLPNESKNFTVDWTNELEGTDALGTYNIELKISASPYNQSFVTRINQVFVPQNYLLLAGGGIVLIIISVLAFQLISRRKTKKSE